MMWLWQMVLSFLVWLSADPHVIATEPARCAAAVAAARATLVGAVRSNDGVESVAAIKTPKFDAHAQQCKQCHNRRPGGPGLCDEGRRLYQQDVRDQRQTCVSGSCGA